MFLLYLHSNTKRLLTANLQIRLSGYIYITNLNLVGLAHQIPTRRHSTRHGLLLRHNHRNKSMEGAHHSLVHGCASQLYMRYTALCVVYQIWCIQYMIALYIFFEHGICYMHYPTHIRMTYNIYIEFIAGWWFQRFFISIIYGYIYMGYSQPHWLSYFSRWLLHHQPDRPVRQVMWHPPESLGISWNSRVSQEPYG